MFLKHTLSGGYPESVSCFFDSTACFLLIFFTYISRNVQYLLLRAVFFSYEQNIIAVTIKIYNLENRTSSRQKNL